MLIVSTSWLCYDDDDDDDDNDNKGLIWRMIMISTNWEGW